MQPAVAEVIGEAMRAAIVPEVPVAEVRHILVE
jgi:hypothetical protein